MSQLTATDRRRLRDLYHLSPLLWAVVRGCNDSQSIARRLAKPLESIDRGIHSARQSGLLRYDQGLIVPAARFYFDLYRALNPGTVITEGSGHPIIAVLGHKTMTTGDIASALDRSYHSTYKTLQRLHDRGDLIRVNKRWRRA